MFAGAVRETVFSRPEVIQHIKKHYVPVALKAGEVMNPPRNLEGDLYREIARSRPIPQGLCVANSSGKVISWVVMFDKDKDVIGFLESCQKRYQAHPDASKPLAAARYMRFPSKKLPDIPDNGKVIPVPDDAVAPRKHSPKGALKGRIVGRALDSKGKPFSDTTRQENYVEATAHISPTIQRNFLQAWQKAGKEKFAVPRSLSHFLVSKAYLGQLDVNPLGGPAIQGHVDQQQWSFQAQQEKVTKTGSILIRIDGISHIAGSDRSRGRKSDGRVWKHDVQLRWEGYIELKDRKMTRLHMVAEGREKLVWGNKRWQNRVGDDVAHLPSGRAINVDQRVRYGLLAKSTNE